MKVASLGSLSSVILIKWMFFQMMIYLWDRCKLGLSNPIINQILLFSTRCVILKLLIFLCRAISSDTAVLPMTPDSLPWNTSRSPPCPNLSLPLPPIRTKSCAHVYRSDGLIMYRWWLILDLTIRDGELKEWEICICMKALANEDWTLSKI